VIHKLEQILNLIRIKEKSQNQNQITLYGIQTTLLVLNSNFIANITMIGCLVLNVNITIYFVKLIVNKLTRQILLQNLPLFLDVYGPILCMPRMPIQYHENGCGNVPLPSPQNPETINDT
jgi:hypothetical protein